MRGKAQGEPVRTRLVKLERSEQLKRLPTLKLYRRLRGDMIEVFNLVHNYYDSEAAVNLNFNTRSTTRRNTYKLHSTCAHHNSLDWIGLNWCREFARGIKLNLRLLKM